MTHFISLDIAVRRNLTVLSSGICAQEHAVRSTGVVLSEIPALTRYYPIVLIEDEKAGTIHTAAVLGFDQGENLFAGHDGWRVPRRPLNLIRAPFAIGTDGELMVDCDSSLVAAADGSPIFEMSGAPGPALAEALAALDDLQAGFTPTQHFIHTLLELGLVEPYSPGLSVDLRGLYTVNTGALRRLTGGDILVLHDSGYLETIHMMAASLAHFETLFRLKQGEGRWVTGSAA